VGAAVQRRREFGFMTEAERVIDECLEALKAARLVVLKSTAPEARRVLSIIESAIGTAASYAPDKP
jgi:hypothetical protein